MRGFCFRLWATLRRLVGGGAGDEDLGEEVRSFVEHDTESKIQSGMTLEDARRAALIELGGAEQIKERVREERAGAHWESVFRDTRYAVRSLGQARWFSFSVIGSLSLGLAATIVAFAFINGALLRPFPGVQDQDRLVEIEIKRSGGPLGPSIRPTAMEDYPSVFRALGEGMASLEDLASFTNTDVAVSVPQPLSLPAAFVSPNYFGVLGVRPEIGRTFAPEEDTTESTVAIIGHGLWMREFGGDPSVIGRPIQVGRQIFEVIGVAGRGFTGTSFGGTGGVDLFLPIALTELVSSVDIFQPGERWVRYVGRMRDGIRIDRVETELGVVAAGIVRSADDIVRSTDDIVPSADDSAEPFVVEVSRLSVLDSALEVVAIILSIPLLVLVIACVNAANLLLVRASRRGRELALRLALGASRARLARQLVIECLILAIGAALLALPLAWLGLGLLATFRFPMPLDGTVVAGALMAAILTALGFGLAPALRVTRQDPSRALGTSPAGTGGTRSQSRGRGALVSGQVALSLGVLAVGFQLTAGLESQAKPRGTEPDRLLVASFDLEQLRFSSAESDAFYSALLDGASRLPGVEAAGLSRRDLLWTSDRTGDNGVILDPRVGAAAPAVSQSASGLRFIQPGQILAVGGTAGGDFFGAVGLELLQGREFVAADRGDTPEVAIITERLASQSFQGAALGRTLHVSTVDPVDVRVVGIVESPADLYGQDVAAIFFPSPVQDDFARTLYVRSGSPAGQLAPAIRDLVTQIDPQVPILELATLDQKIRADVLLERTLARAAAVLGIAALLLASIGLYGVTSYSVAMRRREIAVRMALGARRGRVLVMVLRHALMIVTIGSVLGGVAAVVAGLLIQAEVFGIDGVPLATLSGAAALLGVTMVLASVLPARRAARLDPNVVLREE